MEPEAVKAICQAIHDATPPASKSMKLPSPAMLLDTAILALEELQQFNAAVLPQVIDIVKALKTFTPG